MGKGFLILLALLTGCVSSRESDLFWLGGCHVHRMEVYNARTNELIRTFTTDNLIFYRIYQDGYLTLSMELDGQTIWRLEGDSDDINKPYDNSDKLQLNLSKFEFIVIEWMNRYDCIMKIQNGSIINGFNGLVNENEPVLINVYMTEFV
jgi:hypothetical protein